MDIVFRVCARWCCISETRASSEVNLNLIISSLLVKDAERMKDCKKELKKSLVGLFLLFMSVLVLYLGGDKYLPLSIIVAFFLTSIGAWLSTLYLSCLKELNK